MKGTRSEIEANFRAMVKSLMCPFCGEQFTDSALDWGDGWREGRRAALLEHDVVERDGPYRIKCQSCGDCSWVNYFAGTVSKTRPE